MTKSLETLRKERERLLRKKRAADSLAKLSRERDLERKRLKAEIKALKNPGSKSARKFFVGAARRAGKFLKERAAIVAENARREEMMERKRMQMKKKKAHKKGKKALGRLRSRR